MAAKQAAKPPETKEAPPAKRGKGLLIGAVVALLLVAGVGAGWYFTRPAAVGEAAAKPAPKPVETVFVNLEPFTVNLADEGGERLAQVGIVLELSGKDVQAQLSRNLPIVRNNTLLLLSSQHSKTLLSLDGKLALAAQIGTRTAAALGWKDDKADPARSPNPVVAVHFSQMLVQ